MDWKDQARSRRDGLVREREAGQKALGEARVRMADLEQTLLRIEGAIQVLDEMLSGRDSES